MNEINNRFVLNETGSTRTVLVSVSKQSSDENSSSGKLDTYYDGMK